MSGTLLGEVTIPTVSTGTFLYEGDEERRRHILIVLIPGWGETTQSLQPLAAFLNQQFGYSVAGICYGGDTVVEDWEEGWYTPFRDQLQELLQLNWISEIHLAGLSLGGLFADLVSTPSELSSLKFSYKICQAVNMSPPFVVGKHGMLFRSMSLSRLQIELVSKLLPTIGFGRPSTPELLEPYRGSVKNRPTRSILELARAIRAINKRLKRDKVKLLVLVLWARRDSVVDNKRSRCRFLKYFENRREGWARGPHNFLLSWCLPQVGRKIHEFIESSDV